MVAVGSTAERKGRAAAGTVAPGSMVAKTGHTATKRRGAVRITVGVRNTAVGRSRGAGPSMAGAAASAAAAGRIAAAAKDTGAERTREDRRAIASADPGRARRRFSSIRGASR